MAHPFLYSIFMQCILDMWALTSQIQLVVKHLKFMHYEVDGWISYA